MPITYVSAAAESSTSISSMPAHSAGDFLLMIALQTSTTTPSLASGWASAASGSGYRIGYKVATSGAETSGTWTNASMLFCLVYKGVNPSRPIGVAGVGSGTSNTITYPAVTMTKPNVGWGVRAGYATEAGTCPVVANPPGYSTRASDTDSSTYGGKSFDSNGIVASIETGGGGMGPHNYPWRAVSMELLPLESGALFWAFP